MKQPAIQVNNLNKSFGPEKIFNNLSFQIPHGQITALIGPNGCGKTTLFNILAGIIKPDNGNYQINNYHPFKLSYVFQNYRDSLLPWRKNIQNLIFPLQIQKLSKPQINGRLISLPNLKLDLNKYPGQLSGGQQQILTFLRALITQPKLLLLDEPFSALDYETKIRLQNKLQHYYLKTKATVFIITHDVEEAVYLAHNIYILSKKPTVISQKITNQLDYPRTVEKMLSQNFQEIKNSALKSFQLAAKL